MARMVSPLASMALSCGLLVSGILSCTLSQNGHPLVVAWEDAVDATCGTSPCKQLRGRHAATSTYVSLTAEKET